MTMMMWVTMMVGSVGDLNAGLNVVALTIQPLSGAILTHLIADADDTFKMKFVSSEGALYVILPYDYPQRHPLFEHTPVLNNNFEY